MAAVTQAGIMLLPAPTPPLDDDAHLTLVWAGDDVEYTTVSQLCYQAHQLAWRFGPFAAATWGTDLYGDNHNEPVIRVARVAEIVLMRSTVESFNRSQHPFSPHVSIPKLTNKLPRLLYFNKIAVWWGSEERQEWWLGSGALVSQHAGAPITARVSAR